jgi:hypothetical protein
MEGLNEEKFPIEEHAKKSGVSPSVLAAVMQARQWAAGKKVDETVFNEAVTAFLGGSMRGK